MSDVILDYVVSTGGSTVDELLIKLPDRPSKIVAGIKRLANKGFLLVSGPKDVQDLEYLVNNVAKEVDFPNKNEIEQRGRVLEEIIMKNRGFMETTVRPTARGTALTLG